MKKNDIIKLFIEDTGVGGEGIGRYNGMPFFVSGSVVGDNITAGITKLKKNYGYARLISIDEPSAFRTDPPCAVSRYCGGCSIMPLSYEKQLSIKEKTVENALLRIGQIASHDIARIKRPIIGMENPFHYRNKAQYPVGIDKDGNPVIGFYAPHSHRIVEAGENGCCIGHRNDPEIISAVKKYIVDSNVSIYDEKKHKGLLRHVIIRHGFETGETMVCLVVNGRDIPGLDKLINSLRCASDSITSIVLNENTAQNNVIMGAKSRKLWGNDHIKDILLGNVFRISAESFYQINPRQTARLYEIVRKYASLTGKETVWDLYCGIGTIGICLARNAKKVIGIEVIEKAVKDAGENAVLNKLDNISFFTGTADELFSEDMSVPRADVIVVDPPRKGLDGKTISLILDAAPDKLIYVSCNPSTLARDLAIITKSGYEIKEYTPVDQFPHSMHVETVCLLGRRKPDDTIKVSVNMDDYYQIRDAEEAEKNPS